MQNETTQVPATTTAFDISKLETWKDKATRVKAAGSLIQKVASAEEVQSANDFLVKARKTLNGWEKDGKKVQGVKEERLELTRKLQEVKEELMQPEKDIEAEMGRVQKMLNDHATAQLNAAKQQQEQQTAAREQSAAGVDVRAMIRSAIVNKTIDAIAAMNNAIKAFVPTILLENWDVAVKRFYVEPKLKPEIYESFFQVVVPREQMVPEQVAAIVAEMKAEHTYEKCNATYTNEAKAVLKMWADDLPKLKEKLEDEKRLGNMGANGGAERTVEQKQAILESICKNANVSILESANNLRSEAAAENEQDELKAEVDKQFISQVTAPIKNVRTKKVASIDCKPTDIAKVWGKVIFAIYLAEGPKAHLKENGELKGWAQELLNKVADLETAIEGVKIEEVASVVAKA